MSVQLIKDVARRAMKPRGLTPTDWRAIRGKYRGKVSHAKVDFVLRAYSDGIVTRQERAGMVRLFGKSKTYLCVRRKVEGEKGLALRDIRRALKGVATSKGSARRAHQLALLSRLEYLNEVALSYTPPNRCNVTPNTFISRAVVGAVIVMLGDPAMVRRVWQKMSIVLNNIKSRMSHSDWKKMVALLWHRRTDIRLNSLKMIAWKSWPSSWRYSRRAIRRLMYLARKDSHKWIRRIAARQLCGYRKKRSVAILLKRFNRNPSNRWQPLPVCGNGGVGETRPTASP